MCLVPEHLPDGTVVVRRRCADGTAPAVFRGDVSAWITWTPPEVLRHEDQRHLWPTVEA